MFDKEITSILKPLIDAVARRIIRYGIRANSITIAGFLLGLCTAGLIVFGQFCFALSLMLVSRLFDALDGAVARQSTPTDLGGFLDITLDFIFYASIPLAFAFLNPTTNALAAATLLFAFMGTAATFLAFACVAAKKQIHSSNKSIYFLGGLTESFETLFAFSLMCVIPNHFDTVAYIFAALCGLTTLTRILAACQSFI
jgi:phosphatidylglycerophosphate synthase